MTPVCICGPSFSQLISGHLDSDAMAGIVFVRCLRRTLESASAARAIIIRGTNRNYGTTLRRTATALTVNNDVFLSVFIA